MQFTFEPDDLEILHGIVEECNEHLNGIEEGILKLEIEFTIELLDSVFRAMHSIKGVASFLEITPIKDTAHVLESFLTDMKKGQYSSSSEITDALLRGVDILNAFIQQLGQQIQEIEANPVKEIFTINIEEIGYQEFIAEVEELRQIEASNQLNLDKTTDSPNDNEVAGPLKVELSPLYEQMLTDFIEETREHLETTEHKCVELEKYPDDPEIINAILRGFHSIKGGAGVIISMQDNDEPDNPVMAIKTITHATESLLQQHRNSLKHLSAEVIDLILTVVDKVTILTSILAGNEVDDLSIDQLMKHIEALSEESPGISGVETRVREDIKKIPQQLAAFMNICSQALESMLGIINSLKIGQPIDSKRTKQYIRALRSIASTARYLDYDEMILEVEGTWRYLEGFTPGKDFITEELLEFLHNNYQKVQDLMNLKIESLKYLLENVPPEYGQKKIGEILISEHKITPEQVNWALQQQKKLGDILVDSGAIKTGDLKIALAQQAKAREKQQQALEQAKSSGGELSSQSIRVSQEKLDRLMNMIGELLISKNRIFHLANTIGLEYDLPGLAREVKGVAAELATISDELQDAIMSARMVPLRVLFQRYPRTIRDTARKTGKQVDLIIEGEDTELDKTVIEAINDPLVHMLRNAVDHGIESPREREASGKNETGRISLRAGYQGNYVLIEIIDDGKGLNPDEIKLKAVKKGLISIEQIENLTNEDALQLIFAPGFSTREEVSELSGRGVGMDVVKTNIEKVGGAVNLTSTMGEGTHFSLKIPLSMSILRGLMVESEGQHFIIPLDTIEETVKLPGSSIRSYKTNMVADIREQIIPLIGLQDVLQPGNSVHNIKQYSVRESVPIVVIANDGNKFGLIVDSFKNEQEFVVKPLAEELASLKIYTGATILGDGSVVLILNPFYLLTARALS
ncbi:MAG: chemotaxis protein CheA [Syntrophomonadaceae bacterium]|nr:chemotaxis protein CheA [Syntrophomonadaceae bacterium]